MKHYAIIPARKGSKSILNKNMVKLDHKNTLVEMAINLANETKLFEKVILSTDIPYYYEFDRCEVHKRPNELAEDESLMIDVVRDVITKYEIPNASYIWLLQPTTPFRKLRHFWAIQRILLKKPEFAGVISIQSVGANHPDRMYTRKDNKLYRMSYTSFKNKQDLLDIFIRNGAFYVLKTSNLKSKDGFDSKPVYGYLMEEAESINIDSPWDLAIAKFVQKGLHENL
jgi:N-acylneuraminate cytidylyltransferase